VRLQFLLKLYFAREFGEETIARLIIRQIIACEQFIHKLQGTSAPADGQASDAPPAFTHDFRSLIQHARIRQIEATIAWLVELRGQAAEIATSG
jgi:hypothetical protein